LSSNRLNNDAEYYQKRFDPLYSDRKARRKRKVKVHHQAKREEHDIMHDVADITGLEEGLQITYQPSKYEASWLMSSLTSFYEQDQITDVIALVKGGKEASVYCCEASPSMGVDLVAAKIYRPRMFRQLRNDKMYQEGRQLLEGEGKKVKERDQRLQRAVGQKTAFGAEVSHQSWLLHEYVTLQALYKAGAAVPAPYAVGHNAILMGYVGDESTGAPPLIELRLEHDEAQVLFDDVIHNIDLMLQHDMIHGDLSAYNILYWEGKITLIDFPQVTQLLVNSNARFILERDVTRVCEYFARQGVRSDPRQLVNAMWEKHALKRRAERTQEDFETEFEHQKNDVD
jgi:RIO kinase 1